MSKRTLINGRYELEPLPLARGGMGEVWAAHDTQLDRPVVVKLIRSSEGVPESDDYVRRFLRESRITARLQHPGVPAVHDVGVHEGRHFLVMQRIHGMSLSDLIAESGQLELGWTASIAAQICAVLSVAHGASLVHRDLKPSNVMVEPDGGVKVLDFGLAVAPTLPDFSKITQTGQPVGTPAYMAPEQIVAGVSGPTTDLYALGCTIHEMLTGRHVFDGSTPFTIMSQQVSEKPPPLRDFRSDVPVVFEELVLDLLAKRPEDRPPTADLVYERLMPFAIGLGPMPGILDPPSKPSPVRMYASVLSRVFVGVAGPGPTEPPPTHSPAAGPTTVSRQQLADAREEAAALVRQSRFSQAAEALASVLEAAGSVFDPADRDVVSLRLDLANARFEGGDYRAAAPEYRALARDLEAQKADPALVLQCRLKEATCHALAGDVAHALEQLQGLEADQSRVFGPNDPRTIELRRQIALLQLGAGDREAAVLTLSRLHRDLVRLHGKDHPASQEVDGLLTKLL